MSQSLPDGDQTDFSLVLGGPLYQLYLRTRIARRPLELVKRRVLVISLIAWLPLLLLSAVGGSLVGAAIRIPFLFDVEAHVRFLIALPILVLAELVVHRRLRDAVEQFVERGIVLPEDMPKFRAAIDSVMRVRNSAAVEAVLLVLVYTAGLWVWRNEANLEVATWYAVPLGSRFALNAAGYWYVFISIPIFQFILLRWYFRIFLWFWFLWRVAGLKLNLVPTHPDRTGGLGFIAGTTHAFGPILFAQGALLAGLIANRIFHDGQTLLGFKMDAIGLIVFLVFFILAPLTVFSPQLVLAKRQGLREYGALASRYVREFDEKWIRHDTSQREALMGSGDIQSLADLGNSYAVISDMRQVPFGKDAVLQLLVATAAPLLPLILTVLPIDELVDRLAKIVF